MSLIADITNGLDDVLGVVDELGAIKAPVFILTRVWADRKGLGEPIDDVSKVLPTPYIQDFSHSVAVKKGGAIEAGDILLKLISKESYPFKQMVDCSIDTEEFDPDTTEKFYYINEILYEVKSVTSNFVTWNVLLRPTNKREVYL